MDEEILEIGKNYKEPKNFQEAWNHPDPIQRKMWRSAITKEYTDMNNHNVWVKTKRAKFSKTDAVSSANGCSKSSKMGNSGQDWLLAATVKFQGWTSPKIILQ